jgi:hypothetical protein
MKAASVGFLIRGNASPSGIPNVIPFDVARLPPFALACVRAAHRSAPSLVRKDLLIVGYPTTRTIASHDVLPSALRRFVMLVITAVSCLVGTSSENRTAHIAKNLQNALVDSFCTTASVVRVFGHDAVEALPGILRLQPDYMLKQMLVYRGLAVADMAAAFEPEASA